MIIQCDQCQTRFRLDDSKVKGKGVRVKCTKCQNLFIVTPPEPEKEPEKIAEDISQPSFEGAGEGAEEERQGEGGFPTFGTEDQPPSEEEPALGGAGEEAEPTWDSALAESGVSEGEKTEEEPTWGDAFGEEGVSEGEEKEEEPTWDSALAESGASEDEKTEEEPTWGEAFGEEGTSGEEEGDAGDETGEAVGDESATETDEFTFAAGEVSATPPLEREEGDFGFVPEGGEEGGASQTESSAEDTPQLREDEGGEEAVSEEFIIEEEEETAGGGATKGSKVKLLLLICIIILGAAFYFTGGVGKLSGLFGSKESVVQPKPLDIVKLKAYPLDNSHTGDLFVIEGRILSLSDHPVPVKGIKGVLFNKDGLQIAAKVVSPGRVVSQKSLASLSKADLERRFRGKTNAQIPSKGSVPFMLVFQESIAGLDEYTVEVLR
jgi:predicted Zn finger-like uncharacterized protein